MAEKRELHSTDEHIIQFVGHLKEVMSKIAGFSLPNSSDRNNILTAFESKERVDPAAFHRMGNILYAKKNPTMGEISEALKVPLSTATRMANWWVDNGYAQRFSDPDDRRVVRMGLTDNGRQLLEMIEDSMIRNVRAVLSCLTPEEQTILITLSGKVADSLEEPKR